jgi:hypothetical protein
MISTISNPTPASLRIPSIRMKYAGACAFMKIPIAFHVIPFYIVAAQVFQIIFPEGDTP